MLVAIVRLMPIMSGPMPGQLWFDYIEDCWMVCSSWDIPPYDTTVHVMTAYCFQNLLEAYIYSKKVVNEVHTRN